LPNKPGYSNSKGYRGDEFDWKKPDGVLRVACLGGSTTFEGTYPRALQERLTKLIASNPRNYSRAEVLNFGAEEWTTQEIMINYIGRGIYSNPDIVVVYEAINDTAPGFVPPGIRAEPDYSHYRTRLQVPSREVWDFMPNMLDGCRIVGTVRYLLNKRRPEFIWGARQHSYKADMKYEVQDDFHTYERNLETIATIGSQSGSLVFFVSQAHCPEWSLELGHGSDRLLKRVEHLNTLARKIAERHAASGRVFFVDAASAIPATKEWMADSCHFHEKGYVLLGNHVAEEIGKTLRQMDFEWPSPPAARGETVSCR
jgi:lysophospholipase L1-like esterase